MTGADQAGALNALAEVGRSDFSRNAINCTIDSSKLQLLAVGVSLRKGLDLHRCQAWASVAMHGPVVRRVAVPGWPSKEHLPQQQYLASEGYAFSLA